MLSVGGANRYTNLSGLETSFRNDVRAAQLYSRNQGGRTLINRVKYALNELRGRVIM